MFRLAYDSRETRIEYSLETQRKRNLIIGNIDDALHFQVSIDAHFDSLLASRLFTHFVSMVSRARALLFPIRALFGFFFHVGSSFSSSSISRREFVFNERFFTRTIESRLMEAYIVELGVQRSFPNVLLRCQLNASKANERKK